MESRSAPAWRDLETMLGKVNIDDAFAKTVGMRVVELFPGYAKTLMEVTHHHLSLFLRMIPRGSYLLHGRSRLRGGRK